MAMNLKLLHKHFQLVFLQTINAEMTSAAKIIIWTLCIHLVPNSPLATSNHTSTISKLYSPPTINYKTLKKERNYYFSPNFEPQFLSHMTVSPLLFLLDFPGCYPRFNNEIKARTSGLRKFQTIKIFHLIRFVFNQLKVPVSP